MVTWQIVVGSIVVYAALLMSFGAAFITIVQTGLGAARRRWAARVATQQPQARLEAEQRHAA